MVAEDAGVISAAVSSLNKFSNDGSFMRDFSSKISNNSDGSVLESVELEKVSSEANTPGERSAVVTNEMSANQLAAKAMQLRLKGKHEEAEKLMVRHKKREPLSFFWFKLMHHDFLFLDHFIHMFSVEFGNMCN